MKTIVIATIELPQAGIVQIFSYRPIGPMSGIKAPYVRISYHIWLVV